MRCIYKKSLTKSCIVFVLQACLYFFTTLHELSQGFYLLSNYKEQKGPKLSTCAMAIIIIETYGRHLVANERTSGPTPGSFSVSFLHERVCTQRHAQIRFTKPLWQVNLDGNKISKYQTATDISQMLRFSSFLGVVVNTPMGKTGL